MGVTWPAPKNGKLIMRISVMKEHGGSWNMANSFARFRPISKITD